jgi:two-component system KDP operon response regulator KdpE
MEPVRHRILIVEGDADNCEALCLILDSLGYAAECARTGAGALAAAMAWHPDFVVLDLGLPDIPGERVAETMKHLPAPPFIVGFSGFHRREQAARSAGCDAFVLKPNLEELLALVAAEMASRAKAAGDA